MGGDVPIGDAFKLYWHFFRFDGNGAVGIVLTIFLYVVTLFTASSVLYMYFLRLHNNGRLMDVYHRLHAQEDEFFIPYDLEISNVELSYVSKKAEQWRGEEGERRKVAVYDYIWEEEQVCVPFGALYSSCALLFPRYVVPTLYSSRALFFPRFVVSALERRQRFEPKNFILMTEQHGGRCSICDWLLHGCDFPRAYNN